MASARIQTGALSLGDAMTATVKMADQIPPLHADLMVHHVRETRRWIRAASVEAHSEYSELTAAMGPSELLSESAKRCATILGTVFSLAPASSVGHARRYDVIRGLDRAQALARAFRQLFDPQPDTSLEELVLSRPYEVLTYPDGASAEMKTYWDLDRKQTTMDDLIGSFDKPPVGRRDAEILDAYLQKTQRFLIHLDRIKTFEAHSLRSHVDSARKHREEVETPAEREMFAFAAHYMDRVADAVDVLHDHYFGQTVHSMAALGFAESGIRVKKLDAQGRDVYNRAGRELCEILRDQKNISSRLDACVERWLPELLPCLRIAPNNGLSRSFTIE